MAQLSIDLLCEISDKAWQAKSQWNTLLQECFEHALPDRNPYWTEGTGKPQSGSAPQGQSKNSKRVYDSTVMADAQKLANRLQYSLFPIGDEWANLEPGPFVEAGLKDGARSELAALQSVLFAAISFSNFDLSIVEWLLELVVAGTACMLVQNGGAMKAIVFQAVPQSHVALREGAFGFIDAISRKHKMRLSLVKQTWRDAKAIKLGKTQGEDEDPEVDLIEMTYLDYDDEIWRHEVILMGGNHAKTVSKQRIVEREYLTNPWAIARWSKAAGEVQGRSLVMSALPDARVLSAVKRYLLQQAALSIGGVFMVRNDGVINANNVRIFPGATIPVRSTGGGSTAASIVPLQVGGDVNFSQLILEDLTTSIHKIMLNNGMPEIKDGVRSATEFLERLKDMQQDIGAPFSRVLKEGIIPMLEAALQVLGDIGIVKLPETGTIKLNNGEISVQFTSPLVQQKALREVEALVNAANTVRQVAGPQAGEQAVALAFDIENAGSWVGEKLGVPPVLMRTAEQKTALQEQMGQIAGQQMAAQNGMAPVGGQGGVPPQQMAA